MSRRYHRVAADFQAGRRPLLLLTWYSSSLALRWVSAVSTPAENCTFLEDSRLTTRGYTALR